MADLRPELDVTAAAAFLRGHLGPGVADVRPLAGGELSRAFAFRHAGRALVLRVAADGAGFARDLDAFLRFAGPDLPIPRIIETGRLGGAAFALSERLPGARLADLPAEQLPGVLPSLVAALRALRRADLGDRRGYGFVGEDGDGGWPNWRAYVLGIRDDPPDGFWHGWHRLFDDTFLERDLWEAIYGRMAALVPRCPEERRLVHGDFHPWNLLADAGGLTGVLDWANMLHGDPLYDLATLEAWRPVDGLADQVRADWRRDGADVAHFDDRRRCYRYRLGLDGLRFYARTGQRPAYEWMRDVLLALPA